MNDDTRNFRLGLFVAAMLGLLVALILWFKAAPNLPSRFYRYTVVFTDAPGVSPGTPVRRSGVKIGEVETVSLDSDTGLVRVAVLIDRQYPLFEGDQAVLVPNLLTNDSTIDIVREREGDGAAEPSEQDAAPPKRPLQPGAELKGIPPAELRALLTRTAELLPESRQVLLDIRQSLRRFDRLNPLMEESLREYRDLARDARAALPEARRAAGEVQVAAANFGRLSERLDVLVQANQDKAVQALDNLNDVLRRTSGFLTEENQRNVNATLKNVRAGTDNLPVLSKNAEVLLQESRQTLQRLDATIKRGDAVLADLQQVSKPLAERGPRILRNAEEGTDQLNKALIELRDLLRSFGRGDGTLSRLTTDPTLYNNLNEVVYQLNRLMPRVDRILKDVGVFADKIARHPEALGVGGAISPDSGLKNAPSSRPLFHRGP